MPTKIPITQFQKETMELKSQFYRKYTNAYYEEILIDYKIESRVAQNFRERFLVDKDEIY